MRHRPLVSIACAALIVGSAMAVPPAVGAVGGPAPSATRLPPARTPVISRTLPPAYDPPAGYEAQSQCDPRPKPGTRALARLITRTYGHNQYVGISRGCTVGGTSEHKEGRALDWMTSVRDRQGRANARAFLTWLLGPDSSGIPYGNAMRAGVMYIAWDDRFWAAYAPERGWTELSGCRTAHGSGSDTTCHRNHIHISLTWDGASGRTSLWDGTTLPPFCESSRSDAFVVDPSRAADVIAIPPVRVLSTRDGLGLVLPTIPAAPCRVGPSRWHGEPGGVRTKVTGQGGVPEVGVAAVAVDVTALGSTAPAVVSVRALGQADGTPVVRVALNGRGSGSAIVPVASDGTIALTTSAGATDVTVDVTGYYLVGDQPNITAAAPLA